MQEHVFQASAPDPQAAAGRWHAVCLCAEWCGVCRQYRADFESLSSRFPDIAFVWVDVEDEADLAGDIDIETFPSLVIADGEGAVRFAGPLTPQPEVLARLIGSLRSAPAASAAVGNVDAASDFGAMLERLRHRSDRA